LLAGWWHGKTQVRVKLRELSMQRQSEAHIAQYDATLKALRSRTSKYFTEARSLVQSHQSQQSQLQSLVMSTESLPLATSQVKFGRTTIASIP
jgi:hypothetical protein